MGWSAYEVFTVISGLIMIGWALVDDGGDDIEVTPAMRVGAIAAGVVFIGYAIFVANQTSGVWTFPVFIFALPIFALYRVGKHLLHGPVSGTPPQRDGPQRTMTPAPRPWQPSPGQAARVPTAPEDSSAFGDTDHSPASDEARPEEPIDDVTQDDPFAELDNDLTIDDPDALRRILADQQPSPGETPSSGWYADPGGSDALRWWDGAAWTPATRAQD